MIKIEIEMDNPTADELNSLSNMLATLGGKRPKNILSVKCITIKEKRQAPINLFDVLNYNNSASATRKGVHDENKLARR